MSDQKIVSLCKGLPKNLSYNGKDFLSGIGKDEASELVVRFAKIDEDDVANHAYHGGPDRVVCAYPFEHYAHWEKKFGQRLTHSAFGENLTMSNMTEEQVCIGDIYQIGDTILQVSQGRYPCATINKRNNNNLLLKAVVETGYTGYFFRVLQEGTIKPDSAITLLTPHPKQVTVASIHHLYFHNQSLSEETISTMLEIEELSLPWKKKLMEKQQQLAKGTFHAN
ncbi:MOSC domain-containing protein [Brevibacillus parabrevis]|uniref:MOSC domain-containing protein n=1 Tax=Brevibacillus parabrevis TaxID=54914 RepID=UPI002E1F777D|nr:MOSC domain-containing protein [Brevibacillus parabrevis]